AGAALGGRLGLHLPGHPPSRQPVPPPAPPWAPREAAATARSAWRLHLLRRRAFALSSKWGPWFATGRGFSLHRPLETRPGREPPRCPNARHPDPTLLAAPSPESLGTSPARFPSWHRPKALGTPGRGRGQR